MKSNPLEKMKKRSPHTRFFWCYTLGFLLCAAGCYCWFLIKGKTLIVDSDGWRQHFAAFVYLGQYGREVARTLLATHKLVLPQWDFSIGLGSDVLTTLHFYAIGDPLDLLSVVCPTRYAAYLYSFYPCCDCISAGLASVLSAFVKKQRRLGGITVGALVYVFTLYSLFIVSHHPFSRCPWCSCPCCCWAWSRSWQASGRICLSSLFFWPPSAIFTFSICWRSSRHCTRCIS